MLKCKKNIINVKLFCKKLLFIWALRSSPDTLKLKKLSVIYYFIWALRSSPDNLKLINFICMMICLLKKFSDWYSTIFVNTALLQTLVNTALLQTLVNTGPKNLNLALFELFRTEVSSTIPTIIGASSSHTLPLFVWSSSSLFLALVVFLF